MDREGVARSETQRRRNIDYQTGYRENERGWPIPWTVWQRWEALNKAQWHYRYRLAMGRTSILYNADSIRLLHIYVAEARGCARPRLP